MAGGSKQQQPRDVSGSRYKRHTHVRIEAVQRFFEELVSQLEVHIEDGNQSGLYRHLKGVKSEGKQSCSSKYVKDAKGLRVGGYSGSAVFSSQSRVCSTETSPTSSRYGPRAYLSMFYLRSLR